MFDNFGNVNQRVNGRSLHIFLRPTRFRLDFARILEREEILKYSSKVAFGLEMEMLKEKM